MCGWQVKLCDPLVTHGPYLSALAVVITIMRRYTNNQITLTFYILFDTLSLRQQAFITYSSKYLTVLFVVYLLICFCFVKNYTAFHFSCLVIPLLGFWWLSLALMIVFDWLLWNRNLWYGRKLILTFTAQLLVFFIDIFCWYLVVFVMLIQSADIMINVKNCSLYKC